MAVFPLYRRRPGSWKRPAKRELPVAAGGRADESDYAGESCRRKASGVPPIKPRPPLTEFATSPTVAPQVNQFIEQIVGRFKDIRIRREQLRRQD